MAANLTVAANKRVRGEILALLYSVQPVPVEIRTITNSLLESNMVSVPSIAQHIDYLSGKKYIQVIGARRGPAFRLRETDADRRRSGGGHH